VSTVLASATISHFRGPRDQDQIIADWPTGGVISGRWPGLASEARPATTGELSPHRNGPGIHWPDVDEDISVEGLLHGHPGARPDRVPAMIVAPRRRR